MAKEYFILDVGHTYQAWRINNGTPCGLGEPTRTIEPSIQRIQKYLTDDSVTFLVHRFASPLDVSVISSQIGHVYQCSVDFTLHDALYKAATHDLDLKGRTLGIVDTGVSSYAETISFYVNNRIFCRGFGVHKSIELFISYCMAEARCYDVYNLASVDRDDARKIESLIDPIIDKMYKDITVPTRLQSEYDTLTYQGAEVLCRIDYNKKVRKVHNKLYRKDIDAGITSFFVASVTSALFARLLSRYQFDNLVLAGDLFRRSWVVSLVSSLTKANVIVDSSHPGIGMYYAYLESMRDG